MNKNRGEVKRTTYHVGLGFFTGIAILIVLHMAKSHQNAKALKHPCFDNCFYTNPDHVLSGHSVYARQ